MDDVAVGELVAPENAGSSTSRKTERFEGLGRRGEGRPRCECPPQVDLEGGLVRPGEPWSRAKRVGCYFLGAAESVKIAEGRGSGRSMGPEYCSCQ